MQTFSPIKLRKYLASVNKDLSRHGLSKLETT